MIKLEGKELYCELELIRAQIFKAACAINEGKYAEASFNLGGLYETIRSHAYNLKKELKIDQLE